MLRRRDRLADRETELSTLEESGRAAEAAGEHDRVLAALSRHDEAAAEAEMRAPIKGGYRMRLRQLRDHGDRWEPSRG